MHQVNAPRLLIFVLLLCFLAGGLNAFSLLYFVQTPSHHTGNITRLALTLKQGQAPLFGEFFGIVAVYFAGAAISGFVFHERCLKKRRDYILLLEMCGGILLLAYLGFYISFWSSLVLLHTLAFVLGLQNGMFLEYRGMLVRTTHMSGHVTDAAFYLGAALRGQKAAWRKSLFSLGSLLAFLVGAISVTFVFFLWGLAILFVFILFYCLLLPILLFC